MLQCGHVPYYNVKQVCKCFFFHLRNISMECVEILVHAFVTSKLDYCNSLLYGLPKCFLQKLQYVQNSAARLVTLTRKYDHITPTLIELHWLSVHYRIVFKFLLLTYKSLNGLYPVYLSSLLNLRRFTRCLRSVSNELFLVPVRLVIKLSKTDSSQIIFSLRKSFSASI